MREDTRNRLAERLASVVGPENVEVDPCIGVGGLSPAVLVRPGSASQVCNCLRLCAEAEASVVPAGMMSWLDCGNPLRSADVVLSLARMNRIIEYSPADLTAVVEAGLGLGEFNQMVQPNKQWLPLDPPGARISSLGAIAACASSGPLRLGFGTPRDYVIGLRLAHADGTESKSGGKVVKNVAGYDMNKLYVGSFGTLAVITELILKLRPLAEKSATAVIRARDLLELARRIRHSELQPSSLFLAGGQLIGPTRLLVRFIENSAAVSYQLDRLKELVGDGQIEQLEAAPEQSAWAEIADLDRLAENALRVSVKPSVAGQLYLKLSAEFRSGAIAADLGIGVIRIAFDADLDRAAWLIASLRSEARALGGSLFVERAHPEVKSQVDAWGEVGRAERLMREIKDKFDPKRILNPGRFACGI